MTMIEWMMFAVVLTIAFLAWKIYHDGPLVTWHDIVAFFAAIVAGIGSLAHTLGLN